MATAFPSLLLLLLLFLHLLASFVAISHSQSTSQAAQEQHTLLRLKSWVYPSSLSSWTANSTSHCTWDGVTCTAGAVTSISLRSKDIDGGVPPFICDLRNLTDLDLNDNYIGGGFPTALYNCTALQYLDLSENLLVGLLPPDIDRLPPGMTYLNLKGNNFTGDIPVAISKFPALRELRLDNNLFNGTVPAEIGNLTSLETLTLASNPFPVTTLPADLGRLKKLKYFWMSNANLTGEVPEAFGGMAALEHLDLSKNGLTGKIPAGIWGLKNLKALYLYHNGLRGGIPATVGALGLEEIDISDNQLNGSLPESLGEMKNLTVLNLFRNNFSGELPAGIGNISTLRDIRIFTNQLSGPLPPDLGKHSKLFNLEVATNAFSGELPPDLCAGGNFTSLVAFENWFTGTVPESLVRCTTLKSLQLYSNRFSGEIPKGVLSLEGMQSVIVHDNEFTGELPERLPRNLSLLDVRNNLMSGRIPAWAGALTVFKASNNRFSGVLPTDLGGFASLQDLQLDGNGLSGEIPLSIRALSSLSNLNLSGNQLTGEIPASIGSLPVLTLLDLSGNRLSGRIPVELGQLKLNYLNLSANALTGAIPPPLQNEAYKDSFRSNSGLCSSVPSLDLPSCESASKKSGEISKGLLALLITLGVVVLAAAALCAFLFARNAKGRRGNGEEKTNWRMTPFHPGVFDGSAIAGRLTADKLIGYGGSGQVYRIPIGNIPGELVAVKKIWSSKKLDAKLEKEFQAEVEILGSIRHVNIVKLLCCVSSPAAKLLVYEHMQNGSLDRWLHRKKRGTTATGTLVDGPGRRRGLDWPTRVGIAVGAARGLCYMHHDCSPPIVHRDVKSSNILLNSEFSPKVADFGLARILQQNAAGDHDSVSAIAGSFGYMAPECAYTKKLNEKVDVFSFGVVLLELATGREANEGDGEGNLAEWAWKHFQEGRTVMEAVDEEIRDAAYAEEMGLVMRLGLICTGTLPSTRPSMKDVLQVLLQCGSWQRGGAGEKKGADGAGEVHSGVVAAAPVARMGKGRSRRRVGDTSGEDDGSGLLIVDV